MSIRSAAPRKRGSTLSRGLIGCGLLVALCSDAASASEIDASAKASGSGAFADGRDRVRASLVFEDAHATPGREVAAGLLIESDPGWHIYWHNSGETGQPTEVSFHGDDFVAGATRWPAPQVFRDEDIELTSYGYEGSVLLEAPLRIAQSASGKSALGVTAKLSFVACEYQCVPGSISLARILPMSSLVAPKSDSAQHFAAARAAQPKSPQTLGVRASAFAAAPRTALSEPADAEGSGGEKSENFAAAIVVEPCAQGGGTTGTGAEPDRCETYRLGAERAELLDAFVPSVPGVEIAAVARREHPTKGAGFVLEVALASPLAAGSSLRGIVPLRATDGSLAHLAIDLPVSLSTGTVPAAGARTHASPLPAAPLGFAVVVRMLLFALVGGLILNLMPCVLPVLAIKVVALADTAHASRRESLAHGAAYSVGVVGSLLVLGSAVVALRAAGSSVGWGFQFQHPAFLAGISILLVAFALNLLGVYEITYNGGRLATVGSDAAGWRRSLFEGLLAVLLATPCSAPFLGTAVGFAFATPAPITLAVFAMIGVGLALPFALISLSPGLSRLLPKPGVWMLHLRAGLGFAVLASAVWVLDVASHVVGRSGLVALLAVLVGVGFSAWLLGQLQRNGRPRLALNAGIAGATLCMVALVAVPLEPNTGFGPGSPERIDETAGSVRPYSATALATTLESERPVFVYFTAEWCLTCKVNERLVLDNDAVREALRAADFEVLRADWTQRDDAIRSELARFGRAGVPLYLVYRPGRSEPEMLPELLSVGGTLAALDRAAR